MAYTTIDKPTDYFETKLWSGNATDDRAISGLDFAPDWVWIKNRTDTNSHAIFDTIRTATKYIESDTTDAEATGSTFLKSFTSDGFTLGTAGRVNSSGNNYVGWSSKAGGTASSNTDGDITSTVSANTTSGFSIVTFTGNGTASGTIGHGLGVAPKIVLYKKRNGTSDWFYWTTQIDGSNDDLRLNTTGTKSDLSGTAGSITASTFSNYGWGSSDNMVCYCFAEKKGYSKFGSYTGNGNVDGTFSFIGFKPAFVMVRDPNNAENWLMYDNKRPGFNVTNNHMMANSNTTETASTANIMDLLSNGFKIRSTNNGLNRSGGTFLYMAFAENPFVTSTGIPTTAR